MLFVIVHQGLKCVQSPNKRLYVLPVLRKCTRGLPKMGLWLWSACREFENLMKKALKDMKQLEYPDFEEVFYPKDLKHLPEFVKPASIKARSSNPAPVSLFVFNTGFRKVP